MRIYVASSWRNSMQAYVVEALRGEGHKVYDFKHPAPKNEGFHWKDIEVSGQDPEKTWRDWTPEQFREALASPIARQGFDLDMNALNDCEACVLVLPCGKSAHLELGQAVGAGKRTIVYMPRQEEAELMYLMCDSLCLSLGEVLDELAKGPKYGLPAYAQASLEELRARMREHPASGGLPPPTEAEVLNAYLHVYGTNAIYGKIGMRKPEVWYGE